MSALRSSDTTKLAYVDVWNRDDRSHTATVEVIRDGQEVHRATRTLDAMEPSDDRIPVATISRSWPDSPARFEIRASLEATDETLRKPVPNPDDSDEVGAVVGINEEGELLVFFWRNP